MPPQHRRAALLLAQGMGTQEVADALGITRQTLRRWKTPAFLALIDDHLRKAEAEAHAQLRAALPLAITTLVELTGNTEHPAVRLGACNSIGRLWGKHVEEVAVREQMTRLEESLVALKAELANQNQGWKG